MFYGRAFIQICSYKPGQSANAVMKDYGSHPCQGPYKGGLAHQVT